MISLWGHDCTLPGACLGGAADLMDNGTINIDDLLMLLQKWGPVESFEVGGKTGKIVEISLFTTELATPDNVQIILPNSSVWGSAITNYSHHSTRRVEWVIGISYDDEIEKAFEAIEKVLAEDQRILSDPKTKIVVSELADSSVNIRTRAWVKADDLWSVKFDLSRRFKETFDSAGLVIPFPQIDVHMIQKS